ncbi:MAG: hypothetical protein ACHQT9_00455 [Candidatus Saccharimonadales bacterium]
MHDYWHKQTLDNPLFPDLLWSRPEQSSLAGKLLIIGGASNGFAAPAEAYQEAIKAGIGVCRVLLPDSLQKTVGRILEAGEYAPSTPSGSFSRRALASFIEYSSWADGTLLAGDFGRNSETAIVLESFVKTYKNQLTLTKDSVDYFLHIPNEIIQRQNTIVVVTFAQLQKLGMNSKLTRAFTFDMDFMRLVELLHDFSLTIKAAIVLQHLDTVFVASGGEVSTTKLKTEDKFWRVKTAARASVWYAQNPSNIFKAISTSILASHE